MAEKKPAKTVELDLVSMNIHQRLGLIMKKLKTVTKDTSVSFRNVNYKGISHDAVVRAVREVALDAGVIITASVTKWEDLGQRFNVEMTTRFSCAEDPKDFIEVVTVGQGMDTQDKAAGKAMSYAKKYGLMIPLMLETVDDDEQRPDKAYSVDLEYLQAKLRQKKKKVSDMLEYFGLDALEDMTQEQYNEAVSILKTM